MDFLKSFLIVLLFFTYSYSQFEINEITEDSVKTVVSVDTTSIISNKKSKKSEWGAAFMSLVVPGTGQLYLGQKKKGLSYLSADIVLILGTIFTSTASVNGYESSMDYARIHAGTKSKRDRDDDYWNKIGLHGGEVTSNIDWNKEFVDKYRDFDNRYVGDDAWSWESLESKESYVAQRETASNYKTATYILVGGLIVNRVVSFIDARVSATKINNSFISTLSVTPTYSLLDKTSSVTISFNF